VPALLTGCSIAAYSAVDRVGVRLGPPWLYAWVMFSATALLLWGWSAATRTVSAPSEPPPWATWLAVGALLTASYLLVLFALDLAPLSVVAPVRESAILLVSLWGIWRLRERDGARLKLAGALGVAVGVVLLIV
jgi:drug/metabolite transporter (DMT)-like permease